MIDFEKLRERAKYLSNHGSMVISTSDVLELLDHIVQLERDAGRLDWLENSKESHGFCHSGYGEYRYYAHQEDGYKSVRQTIDTAMEAKHG